MPGVTIDFNANLADLRAGVSQASDQLDDVARGASRLASGVGGAMAAIGIGISAAGLAAFAKDVIDTADDMNDLSIKTKISVENLSGLALAADQSGTSLEAAATTINKLSQNMGKNAEDFARLGVTSKEPLEAFGQLADVFNAIEDPQARAAFGAKALGKSWQDVAPLLALGSQGLGDIVSQGRAASGITTELAQASDEFNDSIATLQANARGLAVQGFAPLVPILNELIGYFSDADTAAGKVSESGETLKEVYKTVAESVAVVDFGFQLAGKSAGALAAKMASIISLDFDNFAAIDEAFKEDMNAANARLDEFFNRIENGAPKSLEVPIETNISAPSGNPIDVSAGSAAIDDFIKTGDDGQKVLSAALKRMQGELSRHLRGLEGAIEEEVGQYDLRNKKLEIALDLGLVSQEDYFQQKGKLQKDQLAETERILDQEINALRQFQTQATSEAAKNDAQEKINDLIRQKTALEREGQMATLENAAAARAALGDYYGDLTNVNDLLGGVTSNIIGMSKAQADLNLQIGGTASAADIVAGSKIFASADGKSFSDRPLEVGVALVLDEQSAGLVTDQIAGVKDQAQASIALGVEVDAAAAQAAAETAGGVADAVQIQPVSMGVTVDPAAAIEAAEQARAAAQAAIKPIVIPVVYQATNSPANPASAGGGLDDLLNAALASGGR
jgi:hypothetical protein